MKQQRLAWVMTWGLGWPQMVPHEGAGMQMWMMRGCREWCSTMVCADSKPKWRNIESRKRGEVSTWQDERYTWWFGGLVSHLLMPKSEYYVVAGGERGGEGSRDYHRSWEGSSIQWAEKGHDNRGMEWLELASVTSWQLSWLCPSQLKWWLRWQWHGSASIHIRKMAWYLLDLAWPCTRCSKVMASCWQAMYLKSKSWGILGAW